MQEQSENVPKVRDPIEVDGSAGNKRAKILRRTGITLVVFLGLFYGAGGWYFSSQLGNDAFVVSEPSAQSADDFDLEVVAVDGDRITLRPDDGSDRDLLAEGVFGLELPNGWLILGDVIESTVDNGTDIVARRFELVDGEVPSAGTPADLDSWYYDSNPTDLGLAYEDVVYESPIGEFDAWFVPADGDSWAVVVHGKGAQRREALRILESINSAGYPALLISYRNDPGQPSDPSGYYRYGATEWEDVEGAVRYAIQHGAKDVVLVGLSTGAANALSFAYHSDLSEEVEGAIFDAPNIDFGRTVDFGAGQRTLPVLGVQVPQSLTTVAKLIGSLRFDFDWSEADFIDDVDEIDFPMLVFHGSDDSTVPIDVSSRLREERPDLVTLVAIDGAEHVQSWNDNPVRYGDAVVGFLESLD